MTNCVKKVVLRRDELQTEQDLDVKGPAKRVKAMADNIANRPGIKGLNLGAQLRKIVGPGFHAGQRLSSLAKDIERRIS